MLEIRGEALEAGAVVGGRYQLERVVGEGGMGVVWAAREHGTGRRVALKFLREGRETDLRNQERVLREARAAMAISHENVAKIEAVLETDAGVPYLVMELLEGESLRDLLRRRPKLTTLECARLLLPVVEAVLAAHASHIVHRDLKPENVFIGKDQRVRVLDFGIAKQLPKAGADAAESLTSTGALLGTPIYMAPEQIFGDDDIDGSADVWSLGIMLYECLAARRPTDGDGFGPIIKRITTETLVPLEEARAGLPRRITSLVSRMLTRDRTRRPGLVEVRALLASIIEAGEGGAPSERAPDAPPHDLPPLAGSTTGGVVSRRAISDAPARDEPPKGRRFVVIASAVGLLLVIFGLEAWSLARSKVSPSPTLAQERLALASSFAEQITRGSVIIREAVAAQGSRDGATCLRKIDEFDREIAPGAVVPLSTEPTSRNAGVRAVCLMLLGRCDEGVALYRTSLKDVIEDAGGNVQDVSEIVASQYCEGTAVAPRIAFVRARNMLALAGLAAGYPAATAARCRSWADEQTRLTPLVARPMEIGTPELLAWSLGECLKRAAAPRDQ